jgi:hypothetical protein
MWGTARARLAGGAVCLTLLLHLPAAGADAASGTGVEDFEAALTEIDELLAEAHFRTALGVADATRSWTDELPADPEIREQRARLQLMMATAQVALSQNAAARVSLRRALALEPRLQLDETTTSPKLLKIFREVRP